MMKHQQRGSALLMSLVILMVLTVLAVSSMNSSQLNEKMVGAAQAIGKTFQETKSEIKANIQFYATDDALLMASWALPLATPRTKLRVDGSGDAAEYKLGANIGKTINMVQRTFTTPGDAYEKTIEITFEKEGGTPPPGYTIDDFVGLQYELRIKSALGKNSSSDQTQGFKYAAPKN